MESAHLDSNSVFRTTTEMGLPSVNVFTGGHDAHSEREWICIEDMGLAAATLVELVRVWAE